MTKIVVVCTGSMDVTLTKELIRQELSESNKNFSLEDIEVISKEEYILANSSSTLNLLNSSDFIKLENFDFVDDNLKTNYFEEKKSLRFLNKKRKKH